MNKIEKREKNRLKNIKWRKLNKEKYIKSATDYRSNHPDRITEYKLKTKYGITLEDYNLLLIEQNNCCDICKKPEKAIHNQTKKLQKLAVDHCHKTGKVRGLLCQDCNRGLGKFHDNISNLTSAIKYLSK